MVYYWVYHIIMFPINQWLVPSIVTYRVSQRPRTGLLQVTWCGAKSPGAADGSGLVSLEAVATGLPNSPRWNWSEIQIDRVEKWVVLNDFGIRSSQPTLMDQDLNRQAEVLAFSRCNAVSIIHWFNTIFFRWCRIFYSTSDRSTSCTDVISVGEPRCRRRTRKLRWRRCEAQSAAVLLSAAGERDWKPRSKGSLAHSPWKTATCDTWIRLTDSSNLSTESSDTWLHL